MSESHDCETPDGGVLGQTWPCPTCGDLWVAFERYDDDGLSIWWDRIGTPERSGAWPAE